MSRPSPGVLHVTIGSNDASKNIGRVAREQLLERFTWLEMEPRAVPGRERRRLEKLGRRQVEDELARRQVVVRAAVDPEQLRVAREFTAKRRRQRLAVGDDLFDDVAHREAVAIALIEIDVAATKGGLVEVPDERLVAKR